MNKLLLSSAVALSAAVAIPLYAPSADAFTISGDSITLDVNDVNSSFFVDFDGNVNGTDVPGLEAAAKFTLTSFTGMQAMFDVMLENRSSDGIGSRVSALGFNTDPNLSSATTSGVFDIAVFSGNNVNFPNNFGAIDVCFKAGGGPSNCQGGGGGGVTTGNFGAFSPVLNFSSSVTEFTLSNFGVRYQDVTGTNLGTSGTGQGTPIPTPALLPGLIGMGVAALRKRKQQEAEATAEA